MREGGPDTVSKKLQLLRPNQVLIIDTVDQNDLTTFVSGLLQVLFSSFFFLMFLKYNDKFYGREIENVIQKLHHH